MGLSPWQPAPSWPRSQCGLQMRRSAEVYYPGRPDTVQKLCAPARPSHNRRDPTTPERSGGKEEAVLSGIKCFSCLESQVIFHLPNPGLFSRRTAALGRRPYSKKGCF